MAAPEDVNVVIVTFRSRPAFSIPEVLVVLAVAFILAAFVWSVFDRDRQKKMNATCQTNLARLRLGLSEYLDDYDEKFPTLGPSRSHNPRSRQGGWAGALYSYIQDPVRFHCPANPKSFDPSNPAMIDYGYNADLAGVQMSQSDPSGVDLYPPAHVVLFFETDQALGSVQTADRTDTSRVVTDRHFGGSNYVFVDGHVKWLPSAQHPGTARTNGSAFTFGYWNS